MTQTYYIFFDLFDELKITSSFGDNFGLVVEMIDGDIQEIEDEIGDERIGHC